MKILLTGARGFVGQNIYNMYRDITVASPSLQGLNEEQIRRIVEESEADVIIHTAAIADMRVCQADPEASYLANVQIPVMLAKASAGKKLICFSSDQVYNGSTSDGPHKEGDELPANVYATHKLEMEQRVLDILPDSVMLRAEMMYNCIPQKRDFFCLVRDLDKGVSGCRTEYRGATYVKEVAENMLKVAKMPGGAYNFGSETDISMYEFIEGIAKYLGKDIIIGEAPDKHNLWMDCSKARAYGVEFRSALDAMKRCIDDDRAGKWS